MYPRHSLPILVLWLAAIPLACGDDEGGTTGPTGTTTTGDGGGGGEATGGAGGTSTTTGAGGSDCDDNATCPDCVQCAEQGPCKTESEACGSACQDYGSCVNDCANGTGGTGGTGGAGGNGGSCLDQCATMHPDGVDPYDALIACDCTTCSTSCGNNPLCQM